MPAAHRLLSQALAQAAVCLLLAAPQARAGRDDLPTILDAARRLTAELTQFLEDARYEVEGGKGSYTLYTRIDEVLGQARHFQRAVRGDADRGRLYRDYQGLDRGLHSLAEYTNKYYADNRLLQRRLARVSRADGQLHFALSAGERAGDRVREAVERQARAYAAEVVEFKRAADYILQGRRGWSFPAEIAEFVEQAARFSRTARSGRAEAEKLRQEFAGVTKSWEQVVRALNNATPRNQLAGLIDQAERVDAVHQNLARLLSMQGSRTAIRPD